MKAWLTHRSAFAAELNIAAQVPGWLADRQNRIVTRMVPFYGQGCETVNAVAF